MSDKILARITHLELTGRIPQSVPVPAGVRLAIMRAHHMPVHFYRYLYERVGRQHHWMMRRLQTDEEISTAIHSDLTEIHVLYVDGCPSGFVEFDLKSKPEAIEIVHFGLIPDYQGRGLGKFFFTEAIGLAWNHSPHKVTIQTNSLDNPRALQMYQKFGFEPVGWSEEEIEPWS